MDQYDKEALYMIRERNGIPEILTVLEDLQRIDREHEETSHYDREIAIDQYLHGRK